MFILFTQPHCIKCGPFKKKLDEKGITYKEYNALDNMELAQKYNLFSTPALVELDDNDCLIGVQYG